MADINRKIVISGESNLSRTFDKIKDDARKVTQDIRSENKDLFDFDIDKMLEKSKEYTENVKSQFRLIEGEIKRKKQEFRTDFEKRQLDNIQRRQQGMERAGGDEEKQKNVEREFQQRQQDAKMGLKIDESQISDLLQSLDSIKQDNLKEELRGQKEASGSVGILGKLRKETSELREKREQSTSKGEIASINKQIRGLEQKQYKVLTSKPKSDEAFEKVKGFAGQSSKAILSSMGLASLFTIGGLLTKGISEGRQLDEARGQIEGLKRQGKGFGKGSPQRFGVKQADFVGYSRQEALSSGTSENLGSRAGANLALEKAFSLDTGTLARSSGLRRSEKDKDDTSRNILEMVNIFRKSDLFGIGKDDFTQLGEKIDFQNKLNQMQAQQMESVDYTTSTQLLQKFGEVGGSFGDQRQADRIGKINQSLTSPNNDFKQALIYRTLGQLQPDASFFDIQKMQEKGVFQPDLFSDVLDSLKNMSDGENDVFYQLIKEFTGMGASASQKLGERYLEEPDLFEGIGNEDEVRKLLSAGDKITERDVERRGQRNVGEISKALASINTEFGYFGESGIEYFAEKVGLLQKEGTEAVLKDIGNDVVETLGKGIESIGDMIVEKISEKMGGSAEALEPIIKDTFSRILGSMNPFTPAYSVESSKAKNKVK